MAFIQALAFGLVMLCSWASWGSLVESLDWSERILLGISIEVAIGGWLNYWEVINQSNLLALVFVPFLIWPFLFWFRPSLTSVRNSPQLSNFARRDFLSIALPYLLAVLFIALFVAFSYAGAAASKLFMVHDDLHAYLEYPIRALESGTLNGDPFNARRIESALGGMSFLDAIFISGSPFRFLNLLDLGLGRVLIAIVAFTVGRGFRLPRALLLVVLGGAVLLPTRWANLTCTLMPEGIFLLLFYQGWRFLFEEQAAAKTRAFILFVLVTSLTVTLKSTLIFPLFFLIIGIAVCALLKLTPEIKSALNAKALVLAIVIPVVVILPWMLAQKTSSGTLLYPALGQGFHTASYGAWASIHSASSTWNIIRQVLIGLRYPENVCILAFACLFVFMAKGVDKNQKRFVAVFALMMILASLTIGYSVAWSSSRRYAVGFLIPANLFLLILNLRVRQRFTHWASFAVMTSLFVFNFAEFSSVNKTYWRSLTAGDLNANVLKLRGQVPPEINLYRLDQKSNEVLSMQASVPPGLPIYAHIATPFLLDFKRNPIYVADFPGAAGLPPGMPMTPDPEALAQYFLSHSIQYVSYSYKDHANLTPQLIARLNTRKSVFMELQSKSSFVIQETLLALARTRKKVFDNGDIFVLDLKQVASNGG